MILLASSSPDTLSRWQQGLLGFIPVQTVTELGASARDEETSTRRANAKLGRLADLTRREREIAELVASGENNKQIARRLAITERAVKAHLTETFRKLGIADRLKLALLVMGIHDT